MNQLISNLADYTVFALAMQPGAWQFVFDSSDGESVVQHLLSGVVHWQTSSLRDGIGVIEIRVRELNGVPSDPSTRLDFLRALGMSPSAPEGDMQAQAARLGRTLLYSLETVCGETLDVICADVSEQAIKE